MSSSDTEIRLSVDDINLMESDLRSLERRVLFWSTSTEFVDLELRPVRLSIRSHLVAMLDCMDRASTPETGNLSDGRDENAETSDDSETESGTVKLQRIALERCRHILKCVGEEAIDSNELIRNLQTGFHGNRQKLEDAAFCRIYRGYVDASQCLWNDSLLSLIAPLDSYQTMIQNTNIFDSIRVVDERLWKRDCFLSTNESVLSGHSFLRHIVKQIEAIKFAVDWRRKGTRAGGKAYKQAFVQKAFDRDPEHSCLRINGNPEDKKIYQKTLRAFKVRYGKTITARNYLLQLYEQYGCAVLLDRTWDVDNLIHSTKSFHAVLHLLTTSDVEGSDVSHQMARDAVISSYTDTKRCLNSVVFTMGGSLMSTFLNNFLTRYSVVHLPM